MAMTNLKKIVTLSGYTPLKSMISMTTGAG